MFAIVYSVQKPKLDISSVVEDYTLLAPDSV